MDHRYHSVESAGSNTCQWFLDHEYYKDWERARLHAASRRLLWLRGKPGSGKSTIMKRALVDARDKRAAHLGQTARAALVVCFFFNTRGSSLESTPEGFFRAILVQIFEDEDLELNSEPLITFRRKNSLFAAPWNWTTAELQTMFRSAIARLHVELVLYIDALDECDAATNRDLVDFLCEDINRAHHHNTGLKICISSRHYPNIPMHDFRTIVVENYNNSDILTYAAEKMQKMRHTSSMSEQIAAQSSGIFLWTVLVIRKLGEAIGDGEAQSTLLNILATTPKDLREVFRNLLDSIVEEGERRQSLLLLLFVLCAKRPLNLRELGLALAFTTRYRSQDEYRQSLDFVNEEQLERLIVKRSRGLVEVAPSANRSGNVQFIHASVKDFLLENSTLLLPQSSCRKEVLAKANDVLARSCFNVLSVEDPWDFEKDQQDLYNRPATNSYHPLVIYAV
jgi:hypothetical protein